MSENEPAAEAPGADPMVEELKASILTMLEDMKAQDVTVLYVADRTSVADYFVLCSGTSDVHRRAMADDVYEKLKARGVSPVSPPDRRSPAWTLMDYGPVVVHIFSRDAREHYKLEQLWSGEGGAPGAPEGAGPG